MTRSELVDRLSQKMGQRSKRDIERIVSIIFEEIAHSLEKGRRVEVRGFGTFFVKNRKGRVGIDPRDGRALHVAAHYAPAFRPGRLMVQALNC